YQSRAESHQIAAGHALLHSGDVAQEIAQGLQALSDRAKHSPNDAHDETLRTRLLLIRARWLTQQGKAENADSEQVRTAAAHAIKLDPEDPDAHLALAEMVRYQVELHAGNDGRGEQLIKEGLAAAEQVLRQQPWNMLGQATQAALWILRGRLAVNPNQ